MHRATTLASRNFSLLSITLLTFAGLCLGQPAVKLAPTSGPPTTSITVSGSGFSADAAIDIYIGSTDVALALANSSGAFSGIVIQIPASELPGTAWISAVQRSNDTGAQAAFLVETNWPEIGFTPKGKRSNPYENVLSPNNVGSIDLHWSFATEGSIASSPAVSDGVVYIGSEDGNFYALNATTGAELWHFPDPIDQAFTSSAAVADGVVYVPSEDGNLYALIKGEVLWIFLLGQADNSAVTVANGVVYVHSLGTLYALDASTHGALWTFSVDEQSSDAQATPAVANGTVYVGFNTCSTTCQFGGSVVALSASTGTELWSFSTGAEVLSPAVADGVVYFASLDGNFYALNASTGAKLWQRADPEEDFTFISAPAVANGLVYVGSTDGNVYALDAFTGEVLWSFPTIGGVYAAPAVANGVVYVGSEYYNVYALDAVTGDYLWSFTTGSFVESSPAVANGVVYVGSGDNNVYAFDQTGGQQIRPAGRPALSTLHPDFSLKVSQPATTKPSNDYRD